jgi:hypothetical protein
MSTNSDLSSGCPLCHCGVSARVRNSWTDTNFSRKWNDYINYKVIFQINFACVVFCLVVYDILDYFFFHAESW